MRFGCGGQASCAHAGHLSLLTAIGAAVLVLIGCLGRDYEDAPLGLDEWDHGWLAVIEPGEPLDVVLRGNALHPEAAWQLVEHDPDVIVVEREEHELPRAEPNLGDSRLSHSFFLLAGEAPGVSPLRFELVVAGDTVDVAEFQVDVVEDACASTSGAVAHRCGREDFSYHPQELTELAHGWAVALEPGDALDVTLAANAHHPDRPWQVVEYDDTVMAVEGLERVDADRRAGDWGPWEPDSRHSFLPTWRFRIIGVALGESPLVLDLWADGQRIDLFELTVAVVDDACDVDAWQTTCGE